MRESMDARIGNEVHLNDTLQETMSLSDRFGLTVTFSKPEKDLYVEIVKSLAEEYGVSLPHDELIRGRRSVCNTYKRTQSAYSKTIHHLADHSIKK